MTPSSQAGNAPAETDGTLGEIGEFGADRNGGRTHEGFDITADCGTPLVAAHGGTMEVVSEQGQGTLVRISLPRGA